MLSKSRGGSLHVHGVRLPSDTHTAPYAAALIIAKLLWCFGLFMCSRVLRQMHFASFALAVSAISAIAFVTIQRPFTTGPSLSRHVMLRFMICGALSAFRSILYYFGLILCGPPRTLLLADYTPNSLVTVLTMLFLNNKNPVSAARFRGNVMCVIAIVILWLWEDPEATHTIDHVDNEMVVHQDYHTVRHNKYFGWLMASDSTVGCIFLLLSAFLTIIINSIMRKLSVEVDGAKRSRALLEVSTFVFLIPLATLQTAFSSEIEVDNMMDFTTLWVVIFFCAIFTQVMDFYVEKTVVQHIDDSMVSFVGLLASFAGAMVLQNIYATEGSISLPTVIAFLLLLFGSKILSDTTKGAPAFLTSGSSSRGILLGYSPDGLPLYHLQSHLKTTNIFQTLKSFLKSILENTDSRQIFYFLCLNFAFMLAEFIYGISTNSLGLLGDAFHMLFDCVALVVGLYASVLAKWKPSRVFSYGYSRVEVLSGYANAVFLLLITVGVLIEAFERMFFPEEIKTDKLLFISVMGLCVNLVGMFAFSHAHAASHGHGGKPCTHGHGSTSTISQNANPVAGSSCSHGHSHSTGSHGHSHSNATTPPQQRKQLSSSATIASSGNQPKRNANMEGVFLHVLADTLGSVGVIISSILIEQFGLVIADPICSVFISALIVAHAYPLLKRSAGILLLQTPDELENIPNILKKIKALDGIIGCRNPHFWNQTQDEIHCSLHVICEKAANPQRILSQVTAILKDVGVSQFTVQVSPEDSSGKKSDGSLAVSPYEANQIVNIY